MKLCLDVLNNILHQYDTVEEDTTISLSSAVGKNFEHFSCLDGVIVLRKSPLVSRYKTFSHIEVQKEKASQIYMARDILASYIPFNAPEDLKFSVFIPYIINGNRTTSEKSVNAIHETLGLWVEDGLTFDIDTEMGFVSIDVSSPDFTSNYLFALFSIIKKIKKEFS